MECLRKRIRDLRQERGISARALSRRIGRNDAYVQQLEKAARNKKIPGYEVLEDLAAAFEVSVTDLVAPCHVGNGQLSPSSEGKVPGPGRLVFLRQPLSRVLQDMSATVAEDNETELEQKVSAGRGSPPGDGRRRKRRLYVVEVEGDCMVPEIQSGDRVKFDPELSPEDGDWVVATIDGEKAIIKELQVSGSVQRLLPLNGEALVIDENVRIVGVVLYHERPGPRGRRRH